MSALWPFLSLALIGSIHCAGMCGGFGIALAAAPERRRELVWRQFGLISGKALTYALLGAVAAELGLAAEARGFAQVRIGAAWFAGSVLVISGLALCGLHLPLPRLRTGAAAARLGLLWRRVGRAPGLAGPLAAGALIGLLPCGLSWSAIALAATEPLPVAVAGMLIFGLGTGPALLAVALGWKGLGLRARARLRWAAGPLLIIFGVLTLARGLGGPQSCPACAQEGSRRDSTAVEGVADGPSLCIETSQPAAPKAFSPLPASPSAR